MIEKFHFKKYYLEIMLIAAVIFTLVVLFFISYNFPLDSIKLDNESVRNFNNGWIVISEDDSQSTNSITLPITLEKGDYRRLTITKKLPDDLSINNAICIDAMNQNVQVFVDDVLIYEYWVDKDLPFGELFGLMWHVVRFPENSAGKDVKIFLDTPSKTQDSILSSVVVGSKNAIIFDLVHKNFGILITFVLGIFVSIYMFILAVCEHDSKAFVDLGLFSLFVSIWVFTDTALPQLFWENQAVFYVLAFCSFTLMPVPLFLFLRDIGLAKRHMIFNIICTAFICVFFMNILLYITNLFALTDTLVFVHTILILSSVTALIVFIYDSSKMRNSDLKFFTLALFVLFSFSIIDLINYKNRLTSSTSPFFRIGLMFFTLILAFVAIRKSKKGYSNSIERSLLEKYAFLDTLTGLSNRAVFELDINNLSQRIYDYKSIGFIVLDVDGLKHINDTHGHLDGDDIIIAASKCIVDAFEKIGKPYRLGGDEFVVFLSDTNISHIEISLKQLKDSIAEYNHTAKHILSISYGYSISEITGNDEIEIMSVLDDADKLMYVHKNSKRKDVLFHS